MENKVLISLSEYNELKKFYDEVMHNGKICEIENIKQYSCGEKEYTTNITYISKDGNENIFDKVNEIIKQYECLTDEMREIIMCRNEEIRKINKEKYELIDDNKLLQAKLELSRHCENEAIKEKNKIMELNIWQLVKILWQKKPK